MGLCFCVHILFFNKKRKNKESSRPSYSNSISLAAVRAVEWGLVIFMTSHIVRLRLCSYFASLALLLKFLSLGQVVFFTLLSKTLPSLLQVRSLRSTPPYRNFNFFVFPFLLANIFNFVINFELMSETIISKK